MAEFGALGKTGGARRVEDDGRRLTGHGCAFEVPVLATDKLVIALHADEPGAATCVDLPKGFTGILSDRHVVTAIGDHGHRIGVIELVGDLPGLQQRTDTHDHGAELEDAEIARHELRTVGTDQGHMIPFANSGTAEAVGHLASLLVNFSVGPPPSVEHDGLALRETGSGAFQIAGEVEHRWQKVPGMT